jgi:hypothetical protein
LHLPRYQGYFSRSQHGPKLDLVDVHSVIRYAGYSLRN